jgi:hypothetical protein
MTCKKWPNDARVDCLLTFIEKNVVDYLYSEDALLERASRARVF